MMARFGVDALAGYGIGARLEFLMIPLIFGIGSASITMVGAHFGAGEYARGLKVGWISALSAAALSGSVGFVLAIFPSIWANLFTDVEAVRAACRDYLQIVGHFTPSLDRGFVCTLHPKGQDACYGQWLGPSQGLLLSSWEAFSLALKTA
jgi:Na+-driven multidrug efflux pump